jgi:hypothetical protein
MFVCQVAPSFVSIILNFFFVSSPLTESFVLTNLLMFFPAQISSLSIFFLLRATLYQRKLNCHLFSLTSVCFCFTTSSKRFQKAWCCQLSSISDIWWVAFANKRTARLKFNQLRGYFPNLQLTSFALSLRLLLQQ